MKKYEITLDDKLGEWIWKDRWFFTLISSLGLVGIVIFNSIIFKILSGICFLLSYFLTIRNYRTIF